MNDFYPDPKPEKKEKKPYAGLKRKPVGNTDQSDVMQEKYSEENAICEITGESLGEYHPSKVHHFLNKNTYKRFKYLKRAMIIIHPDIHYAYHNNDKAYVISTFGIRANILYDKAEELRIEYNMPKTTI